jgi:ketopantoate reductase
MKITICGGGSLGHVCAGVLSSHEGVEVSILTARPEKWGREIVVTDVNGKEFVADIKVAGRATQGVKLINIKDGDSIAAISAVNKSEEETSEQQTEPAQEQTNE